MDPMDARRHDEPHDEEPREAAARSEQPEPRPTTQAERAVMQPDPEDPDWRYFRRAWHS